MDKPNIIHCPVGQAGQPFIFANALQKLGYNSKVVNVTRHKFNYQADYLLDNAEADTKKSMDFLGYAIEKYDVFHFHARPFLWKSVKSFPFPNAWDIPLLKAAGKRIIIHFRGQEIRTAEKFSQVNPYHYVYDDDHKLFSKFPDEQKNLYVKFISSLADEVLAVDPEIKSYLPNAKVIPRAMDLSTWHNIGPVSEYEPLVIHAPSRRSVKGTAVIQQAVARLQSEGYKFRFRLVEGLTNTEVRELLEQADIVVDQLRIGWYGVLSVEAMALGKPVIAYIRADLESTFSGELPILNANPDNFYHKLKELILDYSMRKDLGMRARAYCELTHDSVKVAEKLIPIYTGEPKSFTKEDWNNITEFMVYQEKMLSKLIRAQRIYKDNTSGLTGFQYEPMWRIILRNFNEGGLRQVVDKAQTYISSKL